jgi:hypothetical protein
MHPPDMRDIAAEEGNRAGTQLKEEINFLTVNNLTQVCDSWHSTPSGCTI